MTSSNPDYYRARAIEEREAAAGATESNVAGLHGQMAEMYDALAEKPDGEAAAEAPTELANAAE